MKPIKRIHILTAIAIALPFLLSLIDTLYANYLLLRQSPVLGLPTSAGMQLILLVGIIAYPIGLMEIRMYRYKKQMWATKSIKP